MLALRLVLFALVFMLVGCQMSEEINDDSAIVQEETENLENSQEYNSDSQVENTSSVTHKLGKITYVDETYISVNYYETDNQIYEYTAVDFSVMTASAVTERVDLTEEVDYYKVHNDSLMLGSFEELEIGEDVMLEYEDDLQKIIIYTEAESTEENTESENETADDIAEEENTEPEYITSDETAEE